MPQLLILELCSIDLSKLDEKQKISPIGKVTGRDGRFFDVEGNVVLSFLEADGLELPLKEKHEYGSKAGGWFSDYEEREDGIYAKLRLNQLGKDLIESEQMKYLSPEYYLKPGTRKVERILGVALVNQPNLLNEALNHTEPENMPTPTDKNDVQKKLQELEDKNNKLEEQNKTLLEQIGANKVDNAIVNGKLAPAKRDYALTLEANALDGYLELEAQTFKATQNNNLNPEANDDEEGETSDVAAQFHS